MKRRIAIVLLLLAGGAIVNVAVAWGCSWWSIPQYVGSAVMQHSEWPDRFVPFTPDQAPYVGSHWRSVGVDETEIYFRTSLRKIATHEYSERMAGWLDWHVEKNGAFDREYMRGFLGRSPPHRSPYSLHVSAGWPTRSLQGWMPPALSAYPITEWTIQHLPDGEVLVACRTIGSDRVVRGLPYGPILPGFIINTLFYALLLWLLFFAPFAARRMLRRRRGLCDKCAYPIGVSPVCTECGAAVVRRNNP